MFFSNFYAITMIAYKADTVINIKSLPSLQKFYLVHPQSRIQASFLDCSQKPYNDVKNP